MLLNLARASHTHVDALSTYVTFPYAPGSPFPILITPGTFIPTRTLVRSDVDIAVRRRTHSITIKSVDAYGNPEMSGMCACVYVMT